MTDTFRIAGEVATDALPWGELRAMIGPDSTGARKLVVLEATFRPGAGHAFHRHPEQEEVICVVSGRVEQWVEREKRELGPGDMAFIPAGAVHASYTNGDDAAKILAIFGPSVGETGFTTEEVADEAPWNGLRG
jgi:quercetin dioxygenase-like cupin family protein